MISFLDKPHFSGSNTGKIKRIKGHFFRRQRRKKRLDLAKKRDRNGHISSLFSGSKRLRFEPGLPGGLGEQRVPQQGRLRHEVASKHRACQTPSTKHTTGNRKRFSGMLGF